MVSPESKARYYKNQFAGNHMELNLVQCYSVTTGKVSTIVKAPSFSSLSSIEVAEINHLSLQESVGHGPPPPPPQHPPLPPTNYAHVQSSCLVSSRVSPPEYQSQCRHSFIR